MWTSFVTKICPSNWDAEASMGPQKTGMLAQMHADAVSSPAMTMVMGPYQVGSNVGYVVALCSMVVANRQTEKMLTLRTHVSSVLARVCGALTQCP